MVARGDIDALLGLPNHAVLAVNRPEAPPQQSVVWYLWDGDEFLMSTRQGRAKYRLLRRDPSASLLVNDPGGLWYVVASGAAELDERGHEEVASRLLEKYLSPKEVEAHVWEWDRVLVRLRPERMLWGA
jgi:PPOX class probable F420-dependent enzyme